jgi:hypothetical protein
MAEEDVPGLAVALVDGDRVLWTEGFGHTAVGSGKASLNQSGFARYL